MPFFAWTLLFFLSSGSIYAKYFLTTSELTGDGKSSPSIVVSEVEKNKKGGV
jgi:hypothetical protein